MHLRKLFAYTHFILSLPYLFDSFKKKKSVLLLPFNSFQHQRAVYSNRLRSATAAGESCTSRLVFAVFHHPSFFFLTLQCSNTLASLHPPPPPHLFMLTQDVSKMPISRSTPSRMTLMTSGGMRSERISDSASGLMFPTARFASSTKGCGAEIISS